MRVETKEIVDKWEINIMMAMSIDDYLELENCQCEATCKCE